MVNLTLLKPLSLLLIGLLLISAVMFSSTARADDSWSRSYSLEAAGQYAAAASSLESILKRDSKHELALLRSGWLNYLAGNYSRAIDFYKSAQQVNRDSLEARLGLTLPLLAQQRWREAANEAEAVIKLSQWNYYAHLRLMVAEEGLKEWQTLKQHAAQLVRRYPTDASFRVYLARAEIQLGNSTAAKASYRKVLELIPGHLEASQYLAK